MRRIYGFLLAWMIYSLAAVALFYRPRLVDGTAYLGIGPDPFLYIWMFRFLPAAIAHLQNPFILPQAWAPYGLNITQATTTPFLALAMWPLTALIGPIVAFNLLTMAIPALAAASAFLLVFALTRRWGPAFIGGWIFGFSSAVFGPMLGHLQTDFVAFIPLTFLVLVLRMQARISLAICVLALSLVGISQFLTSLETYVTLSIFVVLFAIMAQAVKPGGVKNILARSQDNLLLPVGVAFAVTALVVSPFIYYFFQNYDEIPHLLQNAGYYATDSLNFVIPTQITWLGGVDFSPVTRLFVGNPSEQLGYIGLPLLIITLVAIRETWRVPNAKPMIVTLLAAVLLSLGPQLKILGHGRLPLPWMLMEKLPLLGNALPSRLMIFSMLFTAVICAMWLAKLGRVYRTACLVAMAAALMMLPASRQANCEHLWYSELHNEALFQNGTFKSYIPQGRTVLFLPYFHDGNAGNGNGHALLWQVETDGYFRTINGYGNFIPPPVRDFPAVKILETNMSIMPAEPRFIKIFNDFVKSNDVRDIVVERDDITRWDGFLQAAGWVGQAIGNLRLYQISDAGWQAIMPQDTRAALLDFDAAHLSALRQAAVCMLGHRAEQIDVTTAIGAHCLDSAYSPGSDGPHVNWDFMSGWLDHDQNGIEIGAVVGGAEVGALIGALPGRTKVRYFPYPMVYHQDRTYSHSPGQLLLVYDPDSLR